VKRFLIALGGVVVICGLAVGGWQGGWWLKSSATNHIAHIYGQSYGAQTADVQEVENLISQINGIDVQINSTATPADEKSALQAQANALVTQACDLAGNITSPPQEIVTFVSTNCN
jgi:hypothetical protein